MTNSEMEIRGYKPADETYYEYKDEEETPRGVHYDKVHDEDIEPSTIGRYAETKDFKHWPFKVGNAMTQKPLMMFNTLLIQAVARVMQLWTTS